MLDDLQMEQVNCVLCGSIDARPLFEGEDRRHHIEGRFTLVKCRRCGLVYLHRRPSPTAIGQYYPDDYEPFIGLHRQHYETDAIKRRGFRRRCQFVAERKLGGRLLDVGAATGEFLAEMRTYGDWELVGIEPNPKAASFAIKQHGLDIHQGDLASVTFPAQFFDVVTMWDVLEHVPDPRQCLESVRGILRKDGVLIVQIPNLLSWESRLFGSLWIGWDLPRHLSLFTLETLAALLQETGFVIREYSCPSGGFDTFFESLRCWLRDAKRWSGGSSLAYWLSQRLMMRVIMWPLFELARRLKRSPVIVVVADLSPLPDCAQTTGLAEQ